MTSTPRRRTIRGRRVYDPEPQWVALPGWVVARQRPYQHLYVMSFQGGRVGALVRRPDGWVWETTSYTRTGRGKPRTSARVFATWQAAAAHLATTSLARSASRSADRPKADDWRPALALRGTPWEPKPPKPDREGGADGVTYRRAETGPWESTQGGGE